MLSVIRACVYKNTPISCVFMHSDQKFPFQSGSWQKRTLRSETADAQAGLILWHSHMLEVLFGTALIYFLLFGIVLNLEWTEVD